MADLSSTRRAGLSSADAAAEHARHGPNRLPAPHRPFSLRRFVKELVHFFALMLWLAGGLALIAGLPQLGVAICLHRPPRLRIDRFGSFERVVYVVGDTQ